MSCFRFPESLLHELEGLMADFFRNHGLEPKIHWKAWLKLCKDKQLGGLGFRRLREFNSALLAKQAWRVCFRPNNVLQSVLCQKYFPHGSFFDSKLGSSPSYTWRSIWETRDLLAAGLRWKVGDGTSILIMGHPWIPRLITFQPICHPLSLPPTAKVSALLTEDKAWNICRDDAETVRIREEAGSSGCILPWDFLWKSKAPPRVLIFAWRCAQDALPTTVRLRSRGVKLDEGCGFCGVASEDVLHVLSHCSFARLVWAISDLAMSSIECSQTNLEIWLRVVRRRLSRGEWDYFLTICWSIWKARNQLLFEGRPMDAHEIIQQAKHVVDGVRVSLADVQNFPSAVH
ncbi:UNVERIFIED_CONTAM: hypothetical protein Slati_3653100 [Sesamum latifolium]|uniref:Reverse transcriptase zinc-binding domain-containing protein n=1 Tax=Sesamum latifolium TaxID=2727402 RepID=A0AAW2U0P8_9LAMI